jgi:SSS family solute:Na+ symporter
MAVTGNIYLSGSATILIGGIYWKRASKAGALAALGAGLLSIAGVFLEPIQRVFPWLSTELLGLGNYALCALLFIVVSLLFPDRKQSELQEN